MSVIIFKITNPPKFMKKKELAEKLKMIGFPEEILQINIIEKDEMPEEIELFFKLKELGEKFYKEYNYKSLDPTLDYTFNIEIGLSNKKSKISKKINFKQNYLQILQNSFYLQKNEQGIILINQSYIETQKQFLGWLIQKINTPYIKGQNLFALNIPIFLCDERTLLQMLAFEFCESPFILNRASYEIDPIDKLAHLTTFFISQINLSVVPIKPINPLLGETFQVKIGNINCYFEQTNINPPTTNIYCFDSQKFYKIYGYIEFHANTNKNGCKIYRRGKIFIEFNNGLKYRIYYPCYFFGGLTIGKKIFNVKYNALIIDETNHLLSFINFSDNENKEIKVIPDKFKGYFLSLHEIKIDNYKCKHEIKEKQFIPLAAFEGEWTKYIKFNGKKYWKRNKDNLCNLCENREYKLKSDSTFRQDTKELISDDIAKAQEINNIYENRQRKDMGLRYKFYYNYKKK